MSALSDDPLIATINGNKKLVYNEEIRRAIGQFVKSLRMDKKLTTKEVAVEAGCSYQVIERVEDDSNAVNIIVLFKLCTALGSSLTELDNYIKNSLDWEEK